jgi:hypothetical protein
VAEKPPSDRIHADPTKWSAKSQRSVAAGWTSEYKDIHYKCWHCQADAVFSAADQKYTYEEKKAQVDQRRILCEPCWRESLRIAAQLAECQVQWAKAKQSLRAEKPFLARWLELLESRERYVPYRHDDARKNMLRKLLGAA